MSTVVLSPHLDDAVLSASDHISTMKNTQDSVFISTIFTHFSVEKIPDYSHEYLNISGYTDPSTFELHRQEEDIRAMSLLDIEFEHLDYVDGGFRSNKNKYCYPSKKALFSGKISPLDNTLHQKLKHDLKKRYNHYETWLVPYGIGNHVDHLLVRQIAEEILPPQRIKYYVDQPYALYPKNWKTRSQDVFSILSQKTSVSWTSDKKKKILHAYDSQISFLFWKRPLWYPEIIVSP